MNDTKKVKPPVPFEEIVGQEQAKKQLRHMLEVYEYGRFFPTTLLVSPKGNGKTTLGIATAKHLCKFDEIGKPEINAATGRPRIKPLVKVNCASIGSVKGFVNGIVIPFVQDKDCTVLFDEASEIPHKVSMAMLDIFNTDLVKTDYKTTYQQDEYVCDFDFRRQTFIFCTSEPHKLFHALTDRFERIELTDYTVPQLAEIVRKTLPGVEFEDGVLEDMATTFRGNARSAAKTATKIKDYLKGGDVFMQEEWENLRGIYNILPMGLTPIEVQILRYLAEHVGGTSLTCLSAKTGMTRDSLQKDVEIFLQKHSLMEIGPKGREITAKGLDYLKALDGKTVKAAA